jgi:hypothetical protein
VSRVRSTAPARLSGGDADGMTLHVPVSRQGGTPDAVIWVAVVDGTAYAVGAAPRGVMRFASGTQTYRRDSKRSGSEPVYVYDPADDA